MQRQRKCITTPLTKDDGSFSYSGETTQQNPARASGQAVPAGEALAIFPSRRRYFAPGKVPGAENRSVQPARQYASLYAQAAQPPATNACGRRTPSQSVAHLYRFFFVTPQGLRWRTQSAHRQGGSPYDAPYSGPGSYAGGRG